MLRLLAEKGFFLCSFFIIIFLVSIKKKERYFFFVLEKGRLFLFNILCLMRKSKRKKFQMNFICIGRKKCPFCARFSICNLFYIAARPKLILKKLFHFSMFIIP